ncbi:unnamed protein product [Rhizophagus irregularis]|nr:unnamed protein product [Rhizophagus irregularis]
MSQNSQPKKIMIQNRKNKNTEKERYKNLQLPDSSNTQPPSAAPSHERVQSVKERYKNLRLPVRYQTNEPTRDDDDASTAVVTTEIARLREDNEFLAGVNAEFGSENDDLKEEVNKLKRNSNNTRYDHHLKALMLLMFQKNG